MKSFLVFLGFVLVNFAFSQTNIFYQNKKIVFSVAKERKIQGFSVAPNDYIEFNSNGTLILLRRKKTTRVHDITWPQNTTFIFDKKGRIQSCSFYSTMTIQRFPCERKVAWYPSGKLQSFRLARPYRINGYLCNAYEVELFPNGKIGYCELAEKTTIDGYPCASDIVRFLNTGRLSSFTLSEDKKINGILFHKGSQIDLYPNGRILKCKVSRTTKIKKFLVGTYNMPEIYFHPNGQVERFHLLKPNNIEGYACAASYTTFYPDGKLQYTQLARPQKIQGIYCKAKDTSFYQNGDLKSCVLERSILRSGILGTGKSGFYPTGNFRYCQAARNVNIGNISVLVGDHITLDKYNNITSCWLSKARKIIGQVLKKGTTISFYKNENIESISLQQTLRIQGYLTSAGRKVHFYKNGKLKECVIAERMKLNGQFFSVGTHIAFLQKWQTSKSHLVALCYAQSSLTSVYSCPCL